MRFPSLVFMMMLVAPLSAQRADSAEAARAAMRAAGVLLHAGDTAAAADRAIAARTVWPRQPAYRLSAARLAALAGRTAVSLDELGAFVAMGGGWPADDPALATLRAHPRYLDLVTAAAAGPPRSLLIASLPPDILHAEGVAWEPRSRRLLVSAVAPRGIVSVTVAGARTVVLDAGRHDLGAVYGIALDTLRNLVWATTGRSPGETDSSGQSSVVAFDLESFDLVGRWPVQDDGRPHHLGDVVLAPDGTVWATDSGDPALWRVADPTQPGVLVREVLTHRDWHSLQGIAFESSGRQGWVADWSTGLFRFDLDARTVEPVQGDPALVTLGIDGLYALSSMRLIAIQNGVQPRRVVELVLDDLGTAVTALRVLDQLPGPGEPTLGVVTEEGLLFVANTPWPLYGPDGAFRAGVVPERQGVRRLVLPDRP